MTHARLARRASVLASLPILLAALVGCNSNGNDPIIVGTGAPTVIATTPNDGATGVPMAQWLFATFSDAMSASTINTATFSLMGPGGVPVPGTVSYDPTGHFGTFAPAVQLVPATTYVATITDGAKD